MLTTLFISALSIYNVASSACGDYNYAFVLDESGSVGPTNHQASIDFVIELIENDIKDTAQLTALAFNQNRDWIYHFSQTQLPRSNGVDRIIDELIEEKSDFDGSLTGTKPAVEAAIAEFESAGFTQDNILILVTDGYPNTGGDPCDASVINELDANNIRVIIVGVGGFNPASVECLVRGNTADIITIANFDFAPVVTQLQAGQVVCGGCDDYDYAFVLDESGSVGQTNYVESIDFIIGLIQNNIKDSAELMAVAYNHNRDWIYTFSEQQLPRSNGVDRIIDELIAEKSDYNRGGTYTARALNDAISEFENRNDALNNVIILVTDGHSHDNVCTNYNIPARLAAQNIRVIVVGVGGFNPNSQTCLVNDPADIIDIDNFNFDPVVTQLVAGQVICDDEPECYDTTDKDIICTAENRAANKYYFASCTSCCHFIQCDDWGYAWDMPTAPGTMWDQEFAEINPWNVGPYVGHIGNGQVHNDGSCTDSGTDVYDRPFQCTFSPEYVTAKSVGSSNNLGGNIEQVEYPDIKYKNNNNNYSYYGTITLIGVIAFILINNVFIGCWCLRKNDNKVKFEMVGDEEI